ncbi:hypothetical protein PRIPAC_77639 [Pristionchus pacificus]|uniref:Uncharacterized protein n=1 Tax=Pristionchus pacificus TaxID=54126 RepID=A0A2A6CL46_PRIPA|nr:hypothetical protein PRIPAC_77639 [Pristionchus pacificus]|eukprot:PDM78922.1 hypothetical protein PRIPAC_31501 [Pristionchus pacificus]
MSARPFTSQQAARDQPSKQGMRATLTEFDGMDDSACVDLCYTHPSTAFNGFSMEVNGPIVSIMVQRSRYRLLSLRLASDLLERTGGCAYKKPYRSSLYDARSPIYAEITADKSDFFSINTGSLKLTERDTAKVACAERINTGPCSCGPLPTYNEGNMGPCGPLATEISPACTGPYTKVVCGSLWMACASNNDNYYELKLASCCTLQLGDDFVQVLIINQLTHPIYVL